MNTSLARPDGDYLVDGVIKRMILAGFEQTLENWTDGNGRVTDVDALRGFLAGVFEAGVEIQSRITVLCD